MHAREEEPGGFAVGLGIWGMLWAGRLAQLFARAHRHGAPAWRHELRVTSLSVITSKC